ECPELAGAALDRRVSRDRLRVDHETAREQRRVDVAQGVHDALGWHASQRPATQREVEPLALDVQRPGVVDGETDAITRLGAKRLACLPDVLSLRIEGVDVGRAVRDEPREPPAAATDL